MKPAFSPEQQRQSNGLHERVQTFIRGDRHSPSEFETLALDIARFQAEHIAGYARLVAARQASLTTLQSLPPVPVEAFRLTRIAVHPPELDAVRYLTSGTTGATRGLHAMRRVDTYRLAALTWARQLLMPAGARHAAVCALLPEGNTESSSLSAMAQMFIEDFEPSSGEARPYGPWLLSDDYNVVTALNTEILRAKRCNVPLIVVATSFGLMHLLEALEQSSLEPWSRTVVMPTGGFKGKAKEISTAEQRELVASAFGIPKAQVIGEYGMTELSSQLYESTTGAQGTAGCAIVAPSHGSDSPLYYPPPWLEVAAVDPETLLPVTPGQPGLARFIDLANVDSAVCIVTQDRIVQRGLGFELLGREPGAPSRGCSLSTEEWLNARQSS